MTDTAQIDDALVERMVKLVEATVQADDLCGDHLTSSRYDANRREARAIAALLPKPDPDRQAVRDILTSHGWNLHGYDHSDGSNYWSDGQSILSTALACFKAGKEKA